MTVEVFYVKTCEATLISESRSQSFSGRLTMQLTYHRSNMELVILFGFSDLPSRQGLFWQDFSISPDDPFHAVRVIEAIESVAKNGHELTHELIHQITKFVRRNVNLFGSLFNEVDIHGLDADVYAQIMSFTVLPNIAELAQKMILAGEVSPCVYTLEIQHTGLNHDNHLNDLGVLTVENAKAIGAKRKALLVHYAGIIEAATAYYQITGQDTYSLLAALAEILERFDSDEASARFFAAGLAVFLIDTYVSTVDSDLYVTKSALAAEAADWVLMYMEGPAAPPGPRFRTDVRKIVHWYENLEKKRTLLYGPY